MALSFNILVVIGHGCISFRPLLVPPLPFLLDNKPGHSRKLAGDAQLHSPVDIEAPPMLYGTLQIVSANVATMEYGVDGVPFSHKCDF